MSEGLTMDKLMQSIRLVEDIIRQTGRPLVPVPFNGIRVVECHDALRPGTERLFPVSRHRSARVHKKLVRRFGGEYRMEPTIFQTADVIYAHPVKYAELRAMFQPREPQRMGLFG